MENLKPNLEAVAIAIKNRDCVACLNFRSVHPRTKTSYCAYGSKTVFLDKGCINFRSFAKGKLINQIIREK